MIAQRWSVLTFQVASRPLLYAACLLLVGCQTHDPWSLSIPTKSMAELQLAARRYNAVISEPQLETTPEAIEQAASNAMAQANAALEIIGSRKPQKVTFSNTVRAIDDVRWQLSLVISRLWLFSDLGTNAAVRKAATESIKVMARWGADANYRTDIYAALKSVAVTKPQLEGEDAKLLELEMRAARRSGLGLPEEQLDKLKELKEKVDSAELEFLDNSRAAPPSIKFSRAQLRGIPGRFLREKCVKTGKDEYLVEADTYQIANARLEDTRKRLCLAAINRAADQNTPVLQRMLECQNRLARELGYFSWADYVTEVNMAGSTAAARAFCDHLSSHLQPKFDEEIRELTRLKARETGNPNPRIEWWDLGYYVNKRKEQGKAGLNRLDRYFLSERVLRGMFGVWEHIFGLKVERVDPREHWADGLQLYAISDSETGEPLGLIYFDPYRREGKIRGEETTSLVPGKQLPDGARQCPVAVVELQLTKPHRGERLSLTHSGVCKIFHEFGHALHDVLCRSKYAAFAGDVVARDFVEVPSELFEQWAWDRQVLDTFAGYYNRPSRKIPPALFERLKAERLEEAGTDYRWSIAWALADLALHSQVSEGVDCVTLSNEVLSESYLALPPGAAPATSYSSLVSYGAAVYSYPWSESIATDMLSVFHAAPGGLLDRNVGMRLRHEIFEPGATREPKESIEKFLGRPYSIGPFLTELGLSHP